MTADVAYLDLRIMAEMYEDHQKSRIAQANRVGSSTVTRWDGYEEYIQSLRALEEKLSRALVQEYKQTVPPGVLQWQEATLGIGGHMLARLLGHLGHPRIAVPKSWVDNAGVADGEMGTEENPKKALVDGEPFERTVGQLWQYCGHGRAARRSKGMTQEEAFALGNPACKMLVHLIAEAVVKAQVRKTDDNGGRCALGDLGEFYLAEKAKYQARTHSGPCPGGYVSAGPGKVVFAKCKVDGHYAEAGDPYSAGHVNLIALRHLGKEILKGLWVATGDEA